MTEPAMTETEQPATGRLMIAAVFVLTLLAGLGLETWRRSAPEPWPVPAADRPLAVAATAPVAEADTPVDPAPIAPVPMPPPPPGTVLVWVSTAAIAGPGPFVPIAVDLRPEDRLDDVARRIDGLAARLQTVAVGRATVADADRLAQGLEQIGLRLLALELDRSARNARRAPPKRERE